MRREAKFNWLWSVFCLVLLGLFLSGCATTQQLEALEQRVQDVEATSEQAIQKAQKSEVDMERAKQYSLNAEESANKAEQSAQQAADSAKQADDSAKKAERMADKTAKIFEKTTSK